MARKISTLVGQYEPTELFCLWAKVHQSFFSQRGKGCGWSSFSQMFDMSIHSGDIRDQSRKLSKIGPKFGRSFGPSKFLFFSDVRYVDPFRRYSRSKSKVVRNRAEIWTFLALGNFGGGPSKSCTNVIIPASRVAARRLEKFREDTHTSPEVIEAHMLNFRPDF